MILASQSHPEPRRLPPARSFAEATAMVEAALGQLRNTEVALERQLNSLRDYIDLNRETAVGAFTASKQ
jgi:hypothetical protein